MGVCRKVVLCQNARMPALFPARKPWPADFPDVIVHTTVRARDARLWERHRQALNILWQDQFGYGIDCLTEVEAQNLCRQPSVAAIEDFLAQAAIDARGRGREPAAR